MFSSHSYARFKPRMKRDENNNRSDWTIQCLGGKEIVWVGWGLCELKICVFSLSSAFWSARGCRSQWPRIKKQVENLKTSCSTWTRSFLHFFFVFWCIQNGRKIILHYIVQLIDTQMFIFGESFMCCFLFAWKCFAIFRTLIKASIIKYQFRCLK